MNKRDYYLGNRRYKGVLGGHLLCLINKIMCSPETQTVCMVIKYVYEGIDS